MTRTRLLRAILPSMTVTLFGCGDLFATAGDDSGGGLDDGFLTGFESDTGEVGSEGESASGDSAGASTDGATGATTDGGATGTTDAGTTDSGTTDSGTTDSGTTDSGTTDAGTGGTTDSGSTGTTDSGSTGTTDSGTGGTTDGGTSDGGTDSGGEVDYGNCGWLMGSDWYACGGQGEDASNPIGCPAGLVDGQACGTVTGVGCCDAEGTNFYCNQGGTLSSEGCGGVDPGTTGTTGTTDAGTTDAGTTDAGTTDAGTTDAGTTDAGTTDAGTTDGGTVTPEDGVLADDLTVGQVQVTQGVAIRLGSGTSITAASARNAGVVREREALFRAGWTTLSGFSPRQIEGQLILESGGVTTVYTDTRTVSGSADFSSYDGTFRWAVPASAVQPGTSYAIGLFEPGASTGPAPSGNPRHPANGYADLGVPTARNELNIVLVPVRWQYGSEDRTPNLNAANVETIRKSIYEHNPVSSVNISVRSQPASYTSAINLNSVLSLISTTRSNDNPAADVYYEGLVDFGCAYVSGSSCSQWGGTTGVGYVPGTSSWSDNQRASISVFDNVAASAGTLTHELGHNQGLNHAPCGGVSGADASFPYSGGTIGTQGWRVNSTQLFDGGDAKDYMGYCSPSWVADWTWTKSADRMTDLANSALVVPEQGWMLQGLIDEAGQESWSLVHGNLPDSELDPEIRVRFRAQGQVVGEQAAHESWLSDGTTRVLLVPAPDAGTAPFPLAGIDALERVEPNGELFELSTMSVTR